jgi:hypothetical protein
MLYDHRCCVRTALQVRSSTPVTDEGEVGAEDGAEDEVNGNRDNNDEGA